MWAFHWPFDDCWVTSFSSFPCFILSHCALFFFIIFSYFSTLLLTYPRPFQVFTHILFFNILPWNAWSNKNVKPLDLPIYEAKLEESKSTNGCAQYNVFPGDLSSLICVWVHLPSFCLLKPSTLFYHQIPNIWRVARLPFLVVTTIPASYHAFPTK